MNDTKYDVFISYRRSTGSDDARLLQQALKARGFDVFFDYDSLRDGKFDEKILHAIDEAPIFVLLLSEGALDRCIEDGDWVRTEIERALGNGCHIVSVAPSSQRWSFPDNLPASLRAIPSEQVSTMDKTSLFEESIDRIITDRFPAELKSKCRSSQSIVSTVSAPSRVFVGRDAELSKLHELLSAGRIPVVTGPGGMGKSELVFQYAARFRADYPGGLFQIDMETVRDWDDALHRLLATFGVKIQEILGLDGKGENGDDGGRTETISSTDIAGGLRQRANQAGRILLVLDNVESAKSFFREPVLAGVSLPQDVSVVATARTLDLLFRPTDHAVELPLYDLKPDAALELLLKDNPVDSEVERAAAENIAQLLDFRALHLRSVPALLDDPYSPHAGSYVSLEAALRENLQETVNAAMEDYGEGARTPAALWKMTRASLERYPMGIAWIKLAHIASFFSPDGFKKHILRYLWGTLAAPNANTDRAFEQALDILTRHGLLSEFFGSYSMHRLTTAVLRKSARDSDCDVEISIGQTLAKYLDMSSDDWLSLADSIDIVQYVPANFLFSPPRRNRPSFQAQLLNRNPDFKPFCRFDLFFGNDWSYLLCNQPQFANCCTWEKLNGDNWASLLSYQPRFADHCVWEKLDGRNWALLLETQPQFAICCPWEKLNGGNWVSLLSYQPQFANCCPWEKLNGGNWVELLFDQPQFIDRCQWDKLEGRDWAKLLVSQPYFANRCAWGKLNEKDWEYLGRYRKEDFLKWLRPEVERGNPTAACVLAIKYAIGEFVERDFTIASDLLLKASRKGLAAAQDTLGVLMQNGLVVANDGVEMADLYSKAAESGYAPAQLHLGYCFYCGNGVYKDLREAIRWWRAAADQRDSLALFNIGVCYKNGVAVAQNAEEADFSSDDWLLTAEPSPSVMRKECTSIGSTICSIRTSSVEFWSSPVSDDKSGDKEFRKIADTSRVAGISGKVGEFSIISMLGSGAYGKVYEGIGSNGTSALKRLRNSRFKENPDREEERLQRVYNALNRIDKNSTLFATPKRIFRASESDFSSDGCISPGDSIVEMLLAEGSPSSKWIKTLDMNSPNWTKAVFDVCLQIAIALDAMHGAGLLHRDVSPANIIVNSDLEGNVAARLCDFDSTEFLCNIDKPTTLVGTPGFMSPEVLAHLTAPGIKSDQFSLAAVMYWFLAGRTPFGYKIANPGRDRFVVKGNRVFLSWEDCRKCVFSTATWIIPSLNDRQNAAMMKALSFAPSSRYSSCSQMVEAVRSGDASNNCDA